MKPLTNKKTVEVQGFDNVEKTTFSIEQNPFMFKMLSDGVYSDKIKAIVRELGCNAWDSHVLRDNLWKNLGKLTDNQSRFLAPKNTKIDVQIPHSFKPTFEIRDYGIGLSHEQVMTLYRTYGASTKRNENSTVGMFGIGSKSPFCYVDQFTIISHYYGIKTTYNAHINSEGFPDLIKLSSEETTEFNGIHIIIPCNPSDYISFKQRVNDVFKWFPQTPNVLGNPDFIFENPKDSAKYEGSFFYLPQGFSEGPRIKQGNVVYPLQEKHFSFNVIPQDLKGFFSANIIVEAPIGTVDVTMSREEINYSKQTESNILELLENVAKEIGDSAKKDFKNCKTLWEAKEKFVELNDIFMYFGFFSAIKKYFVFKGERIENNQFTINFTQPKKVKEEMFNEPFMVVRRFSLASFHNQRLRCDWQSSFCDDVSVHSGGQTLLVVDDLYYQRHNKVIEENFFKKDGKFYNKFKKIYVFRPSSKNKLDLPKMLKEIKKQLGNPSKILLFSKDLSIPTHVTKGKTQSKLILTPGHNCNKWDELTLPEDHGGYYVRTWNRKINNKKGIDGFRDYLKTLKRLGIFDYTKTPVYGIQANNHKIIEDHPKKWKCFETFIKGEIEKYLLKNQDFYEKERIDTASNILAKSSLNGFVAKYEQGFLHSLHPLNLMVTKYKDLVKIKSATSVSPYDLRKITTCFGVDIEKIKKQQGGSLNKKEFDDFQRLVDICDKRYIMLHDVFYMDRTLHYISSDRWEKVKKYIQITDAYYQNLSSTPNLLTNELKGN